MVAFLLRRRPVCWAALTSVAFILAVFPQPQSARGDITYTYDANGVMASNGDILSVAVSITTDGHTGMLGATDVHKWQWTVTDETTHQVATSSWMTPAAFVGVVQDFDATLQSLSLLHDGDRFSIGDLNGSLEYVRWVNSGGDLSFEGQVNAESHLTQWSVAATNPFATFGPAGGAAPEPSTLVLFSGFGALSIFAGWRKRLAKKIAE